MLRKFNYVNKILKELESNPTPLLKVCVNISAQWLIGRFVRVSHSKSDLINCAGVGIRTPFYLSISSPLPLLFLLNLNQFFQFVLINCWVLVQKG